jgi:hypothetical protein
VAEGRPVESGEREHRRIPPQDIRSRDRRHRHRLDLDVGARLIGVDLQEHVADTQRRALAMGDDDLDLLHVGHYRGTDLTGFIASGCAADRVWLMARAYPVFKGRHRLVSTRSAVLNIAQPRTGGALTMVSTWSPRGTGGCSSTNSVNHLEDRR